MASQTKPQEKDHAVTIMKVSEFLLNLDYLFDDRPTCYREHIFKYFKRITKPLSCNTHVMQLYYVVRVVDKFFPTIQILQPYFGNHLCIFTRRVLRINSCNRFSFCHPTSLLPQSSDQPVS